MNALQQAGTLGQGIWHDNIRRGLITSGELQHLISLGLTGLTSNPTIFEKAVAGSTDYDALLVAQASDGRSPLETYEALAVADIQAACDLLRPVYERTLGGDGFASIEVSAASPRDTTAMVEEAHRLWGAVKRPNAMIKMPATPAGILGVRQLISEGINVNVTLIFSLSVHKEVMEAFLAGLEDLCQTGRDPSKVASVASFFLSRVDTAVDAQLDPALRQAQGKAGLGNGSTASKGEVRPLLGRAAVAKGKLAYQNFKETILQSSRFAALAERGARAQRPLWASTGTKNPAYSDLHYVEPLIGPHTVNTMPPDTIHAFLDHGRVAETIEEGVDEAREVLRQVSAAGIDLGQVTDKLLAEGIKAFADSFDKLLENIREKQERLGAMSPRPSRTLRDPFEDRRAAPQNGGSSHAPPMAASSSSLQGARGRASLAHHEADVEAALERLDEKSANKRIWQKDHALWGPDPTEIVDRLGWLTVTDQMDDQVPALEAFARQVRDDGYVDVGLLGMGGSSLGPEVLRQTFGSREGYPRLSVLDSTVPAWVAALTRRIDPARTLFLVSSKSGTTVEPLCFYKHFRRLVEGAVGPNKAGHHFVAITDPGTPLERLAAEHGFRKTFLNPPTIGGRYSVLSYFGLVPAALMGVDLTRLLERAGQMREGCASFAASESHPGAWLGAVAGSLARRGRDKLTLITSPGIQSFGLWAEQLLAESTGKKGKGIVPVAGEPLGPSASYGRDRLFVYLRLDEEHVGQPPSAAGPIGGPAPRSIDGVVQRLREGGHPVVELRLRDTYDLAAEFFRWEYATAVAGMLLEINPFDQPDVQAAKDQTDRLLREYLGTRRLPEANSFGEVGALLHEAHQGDYLAIMAYLPESPDLEGAVTELRRRVVGHHRIATTFGYGPRFLHSTGQLHKGGPSSGLYLQLVAESPEDVAIPGEPYSFGTLAHAQALGDFQALRERGRRVARVQLGLDHVSALRGLVESIS